jgi:hypothetical protein
LLVRVTEEEVIQELLRQASTEVLDLITSEVGEDRSTDGMVYWIAEDVP